MRKAGRESVWEDTQQMDSGQSWTKAAAYGHLLNLWAKQVPLAQYYCYV